MSEDKKPSSKKWKKFAEEKNLHEDKTKQQPKASKPEDEQAKQPSEPSETSKIVAAVLEHPSYKFLEDKLTETEMQLHEFRDKFMRVSAEIENVRQRSQREAEKDRRYGLKAFATELIPVMDSLEQALQTKADENKVVESFYHGVELTMQLFLKVLNKFSIVQVNPVGEAFDPHQHEAMTMQVDPSAKPGTVISVFQKGYLLHDRVIRPARVVVAKEPQEVPTGGKD